MKKLLLLFIPVLLFGGYERPGSTSGQFLKLGVSARAMGMGEAFLVVVDDASCVYYNPACLPLICGKDISLTHTKWFADINHEFAGIASSFRDIGTFGISLVSLYTDAIEVTTPLQPDGTGETFYATNYAVGVSYGRFLTDRTSIGLTARYIGLSLYHYNVGALSFDLGTLFRTDIKGFRFGMKISNFGPNLRFINEFYSLPMSFSFGAAFEPIPSLTFASVTTKPTDDEDVLNTGFEYRLNKYFALRGGYKFGYDVETWSYGVGFAVPLGNAMAKLDYAYSDLGVLSGSHRITMGFSF